MGAAMKERLYEVDVRDMACSGGKTGSHMMARGYQTSSMERGTTSPSVESVASRNGKMGSASNGLPLKNPLSNDFKFR
jgi:hypothetical protein